MPSPSQKLPRSQSKRTATAIFRQKTARFSAGSPWGQITDFGRRGAKKKSKKAAVPGDAEIASYANNGSTHRCVQAGFKSEYSEKKGVRKSLARPKRELKS